MKIEYDPQKAALNRRKHGVSFADAEVVFHDPLAMYREDPDSRGEARYVVMGLGATGALLTVVYCLRGKSLRIISARQASRQEVKAYEG